MKFSLILCTMLLISGSYSEAARTKKRTPQQAGGEFAMGADAKCEIKIDALYSPQCVASKELSPATQEFLNLEAKIGGATYDLNHVNKLEVFRGSVYNSYSPKNISTYDLNSFALWSVQKLGVIPTADYKDDFEAYGAVEIVRGAKEMTRLQLTKFLQESFSSLDKDSKTTDWTAQQKQQYAKLNTLKAKALKEIIDTLFENSKTVYVYGLLDNNNENVADAQWAIIGQKNFALMSRHWWL